MQSMLQTKLLTSLAKVFTHMLPTNELTHAPSIFKNEAFSFQIAYTTSLGSIGVSPNFTVSIDSPLKDFISIKSVGLVPSEFPDYPDHDDDHVTTIPGLYPDPLYPLINSEIKALATQWRSIWLEVHSHEGLPAGKHPITINFISKDGDIAASESFILKIIDANLPKQRLIHTEWFHTDCISHYYGVEVFSEKYWEMVSKFIHTAATHGINMLLTPLFTPPLDTEVGGERRTVQLIDVTLTDMGYTFSFEKLDRWINLCLKNGIEYFEMSHLFTQWGATAIPKIMAMHNGTYKRIFGWETSAQDTSYKNFLETFLPELITFLENKGVAQQCYFHISDEPHIDQLADYQYAKALVKDLLKDFPIIDALSNLEFYQTGAVDTPIPASDHIEQFIEAGVPNLWTYYCCGQYKAVSNRFMSMPSSRNRIIAPQLFKYDIVGFLHWGYNFWNTQFSKSPIDPYKVTDAGCGFPSGDAFVVYPGNNEVIESLRLKVFREALYDLRAMQMLADLTSKSYVMELIEGELINPMTFKQYPKSQDYILNLRYRINKAIEDSLNTSK